MERGNAVENDIDFRSTADFAIERRSEERTASVFRPILIQTDQFAGFCLLRNLSPNGMRGQVYTSFAEGLPITVEFAPDRTVDGSVIWCKDEHVGIQFDELVDVEQVLGQLARKLIEGKVNRAPRLQIECRAELAFDRSRAPLCPAGHFAARDQGGNFVRQTRRRGLGAARGSRAQGHREMDPGWHRGHELPSPPVVRRAGSLGDRPTSPPSAANRQRSPARPADPRGPRASCLSGRCHAHGQSLRRSCAKAARPAVSRNRE